MMSRSVNVAVVTGGGHGIGRALSRRLAADGVTVVVADIEGDAVNQILQLVAVEVSKGGTAEKSSVKIEYQFRVFLKLIKFGFRCGASVLHKPYITIVVSISIKRMNKFQ